MIALTQERPLLQQHFAFAHGRIGAMMPSLLAQTDIDRLLGASDLEDAEHLLTELKWTNGIDQSLAISSTILDALREWLRREIGRMVPASRQSTFDILWLDDDAPSAAYDLKKKHHLVPANDPSPPFSSPHTDFARLPSPLPDLMDNIQRWENPSASLIDTAVAKGTTQAKLLLARQSGSHRIMTYVIHTIDLHNIRTAVRIILRKGFLDSTDHRWFFSGGSIPVSVLHGDLKRLRHTIDVSPLAFTLTEEHLDFTDDPASFERSLAHVTARDIADMWNVHLSIDPVFAFAALVLSHIKVLRVLLIGKRNALSPQEIKSLLPPFIPFSHYVTA